MPENRYHHFTLEERCEIHRLLNANASMSEIARTLHRSVSSITREIGRNRRDDGYRTSPTRIVRRCAHERTCTVKALCEGCWNKRCASCTKRRCGNICKRFDLDVCKRNTSAPFVCNGCTSAPGCWKHRYRYDAAGAHQMSTSRLVESRSGIDTTSEAFAAMIETVRPLIKANGQSIAHIWAAHAGEFPCSERTFYRYVDLGLGGLKNLDLVSKCRYRPRKHTRPREHFRVPAGHTYADFCALGEEERLSTVEIDCVEGVHTDTRVLLTMLHKRVSFLLVIPLAEHTRACVAEAIDMLESLVGDTFTSSFPLLLTDLGHEFQDHARIERGGRTRVYYCDPGRADQKGAIENSHRLLRRIVPKGSSIEDFSKRDAALVMSHVNSMPRPSLGGASPFDLAQYVLPATLLEGLGLEHIAPDDIVLRPSLLTQH